MGLPDQRSLAIREIYNRALRTIERGYGDGEELDLEGVENRERCLVKGLKKLGFVDLLEDAEPGKVSLPVEDETY